MLESPRPVAALLKMHRELSGNFTATLSVNSQSTFRDPLVNLRTPHRGYKPVSDFQIENMIEAMASRNGSIRQLGQPSGRQKLMSRQFSTLFVNPFDWHLDSRRDGN